MWCLIKMHLEFKHPSLSKGPLSQLLSGEEGELTSISL